MQLPAHRQVTGQVLRAARRRGGPSLCPPVPSRPVPPLTPEAAADRAGLRLRLRLRVGLGLGSARRSPPAPGMSSAQPRRTPPRSARPPQLSREAGRERRQRQRQRQRGCPAARPCALRRGGAGASGPRALLRQRPKRRACEAGVTPPPPPRSALWKHKCVQKLNTVPGYYTHARCS